MQCITGENIDPLRQKCHVKAKEKNFCDRHCVSRIGYFSLTPAYAITDTVDTLVGVVGGVLSALFGGTDKDSFNFAMHQLHHSNRLLVDCYVSILKTINPEATFSRSALAMEREDDAKDLMADSGFSNPLVTAEGCGFIAEVVNVRFRACAEACSKKPDFLSRHVFTRGIYFGLAIVTAIARVVDLIIGVIAMLLSFLTAGKFETINNVAYRALQAPGLLKDEFYCVIKMINPWAGRELSK